jgi:uncharacterized protein YwgA
MSTDLQRLVIALAVAKSLKEAGSWGGETHIQKTSYLLDELERVNPGWEFLLYKHGPYSFDLHDDLVSAQALGLLAQRPQKPYGPSLEVTEQGLQLLSQFQGPLGEADRKIKSVASKIGYKNIFELEKLATAVFVTLEERGGSREKRAARLRDLKPHISEQAATEAVAEADTLMASRGDALPGRTATATA